MPVKRIEVKEALILLAPISKERAAGSCLAPRSLAAPGLADYLLTASDREYISRLPSPKRRAEAAAWRAAVRGEGISGEISYNSCGAPLLPAGSGWRHIGVSHTAGMAAVILSRYPCAIDIERTGRDFGRAASKFVSGEERCAPGSDNPLFTAVVWCAKETLYKFSGRMGLDFLADLRIGAVDFDGCGAAGGIRSDNGEWHDYFLGILFEEDYLMTYMAHNF